jgi:hypothetical protein
MIEAPYRVGTIRTATIPCPKDDCLRQLRVTFIGGRATGIVAPRVFKFSSRLRGVGNEMTPVASLVDQACESGYVGSVRAGAVALRAAAETFSSITLKQAPPTQSPSTLGHVLPVLHTYPGFQALPHYKQGSTRSCLEKIHNLGDSAAHHRLADESRRVPLEPSAVTDCVTLFERMLTDIYGWS